MSAKAAIKIIPIVVVLGLSAFGIVLISGLLNTTSLVQSHGTITVPPSTLTLGIYSNSACTTPITDISWGASNQVAPLARQSTLRTRATSPQLLVVLSGTGFQAGLQVTLLCHGIKKAHILTLTSPWLQCSP